MLGLSEIDPKEYYIKILKGKKMLEEGESSFSSLEQWNNNLYKYEIMYDAFKFRDYLREISKPKWYNQRLEIGMYPKPAHTPLFTCKFSGYIDEFIIELKKSNNIDENIKKNIIKEIESTTFSKNVFCHMCLDYRSFIVKENKLVGIKNWEYAGYYPPELEDIIHRYLEYLNF